MVKLTGTFSRLQPQKIMVVGDLMLDTYTIGKARRISPEAPVAVISVVREENRPGGAGNVVLNLVSLGASVVVVGRIGPDAAGNLLQEGLSSESVDIRGIVRQEGFQTPTKNRIIAENQQIVRVDYETVASLTCGLEHKIIAELPMLMSGISAVAISDYGKGFLTPKLLKAVIENAKSINIPVITDPKGLDFTKYSGSTIIKPNLTEAYAAAGVSSDVSLDVAAQKILQHANAEMLMITKSEAGISIFSRCGKRHDFPVNVREVKDVTGAGDTVLAILTAALANGLDVTDAAQLSNIAAGIAIERFGCARISLSDLAKRLLEIDVVNKVFDGQPIYALREALKGQTYKLLVLNEEEGMTSSVYSAIRKISSDRNAQVVVFLKGSKPESEFLNLLASIQDIKFILLQEDNLKSLIEGVIPSESFVVNGNQLALIYPHDLLTSEEC